MNNEQEAKKIAAKRSQLQREQNVRTQKHLTLDEIGRRIALGGFQEINIIVKGDVDGSIEALSDTLEQLSTAEIKVNIIQKAVGQISESDVMLAAASDCLTNASNAAASCAAILALPLVRPCDISPRKLLASPGFVGSTNLAPNAPM